MLKVVVGSDDRWRRREATVSWYKGSAMALGLVAGAWVVRLVVSRTARRDGVWSLIARRMTLRITELCFTPIAVSVGNEFYYPSSTGLLHTILILSGLFTLLLLISLLLFITPQTHRLSLIPLFLSALLLQTAPLPALFVLALLTSPLPALCFTLCLSLQMGYSWDPWAFRSVDLVDDRWFHGYGLAI